jgi:stringent starvation protein B
MSPTQPLPPKKDVALALLERSSVYVHLDPRQPAVVVPPWYKKQPQLVLQIGLNMPVPIPDLRLDDDGLSCTLSFNRAPFYCVVPWASVFAMVGDDGRGMVWPEDVPAEVARQAQVRAVDAPVPKEPPKPAAVVREPKVEAAAARPKRARKRPVLSAVGEATSSETPSTKVARAPERAPRANAASPAARPAAEAPVRAPRGARKKTKKELPPYLRVVK